MEKKILTIFEGFAGIGAQMLALKRLEKKLPITFKNIGIAEIDANVYRGYCALNGEAKNYGDVTKMDFAQLPHIDILTWTSPCQSVSTLGKREGFRKEDNTKSSLAWYLISLLEAKKNDLPLLILFENVKGMLLEPNINVFKKFLQAIEGFGYTIFYKVLDANDFGVAQRRERVFVVCSLYNINFKFPEPFKKKVYLHDILEKDVDENYFLKHKQYILRSLTKSRTMKIHNPSFTEKSFTLTTSPYGDIGANYVFEKDISQDPALYIKHSFLEQRNIDINDVLNARVRYLTEREYMLLMGLNKKEIELLEKARLSKTKTYFVLGNSICIPVLEAIFMNFFKLKGMI